MTTVEHLTLAPNLNVQGNPTDFPWTPERVNRTIAAPGWMINSTCSSASAANVNGYCQMSGTSQATPYIAGVYARCYSSGGCNPFNGTSNTQTGLNEFLEHNQRNTGCVRRETRAGGAECWTPLQRLTRACLHTLAGMAMHRTRCAQRLDLCAITGGSPGQTPFRY
jgi:Subtilase family